MDAQDLIHSVLKGAFSGRRKRGQRALRSLNGGSNAFLNTSTLLTLGGLAWGVYEAATSKPGGFAGPNASAVPLPASTAAVPEGALRLVRLMISAARADGTLHDAERKALLEHARAAGGEALVEAELASPRPLAEIVGGVSYLNERQDLYVLAFTIVRADESVSGAERIYLAQLAHQLGLSAEESSALEELSVARIDAQGEGA